MTKYKFFTSFNTKKKIVIIALLIFSLLLILGKNYLIEVARTPSIKVHLIKIAKVAIPLKNLILMRSMEDKIALIKSSGRCDFCNLSKGNFKENDLLGVNLRYANLSNANLSNLNLIGTNLLYANLSGADLSNTNLIETNLIYANLLSRIRIGQHTDEDIKY